MVQRGPAYHRKRETPLRQTVGHGDRHPQAASRAEDLEPIIEACNKIHNVPTFENKNHEIKWIWETPLTTMPFPDKANLSQRRGRTQPFLVLCNHCENPPCVRACPTQATFKRESDGIVLMDFHRCIGCRFCMAACPFGCPQLQLPGSAALYRENNKLFPTRMKGVVEKCNFCAERLAVGQMPACVEASNGAIAFGDLYDEIRRSGKC
jgi:Fe-S-cluster-containing dehydrogenase component